MANITLPESFDLFLKKDQHLNGIVSTTLSNYGDILKENKLYFFEEYTDHGLNHIQNVLSGSERLIKKETLRDIISVQDVSYFTLAVILHDIGMHLNYDGFIALLNGENDDILVAELDESKWSDLWEEFIAEAKRFNGKQLYAIFGDENTIINDPKTKKRGNLTNDDRKLIGEFIRKYHPRLAHEIALKGMPGLNRLEFGEGLDPKIKDLIGLTARSHGMDLRKCLDYLIKNYGKENKRNGYGAHWAFLMILLRIGDYLQIDKQRNSIIVLKSKTFESPVSKIEQEAHQAVDHIDDQYQDDPEKIFVSVSPKDSIMHLKLKNLINSIQYELDLSWAVLGELYGNMDSKPEIKYRRITSNLENQEFEKKQNYVADKFSFKANDDIIKLLISPLYGKNPKFGIRELLQNAVDACNERLELEKSNGSYKGLVEVKVYQDQNEFFFEILDNGKGMGVDEIKNYFLKAGASYRTSLDWKKQFIDEKGKTKIHRNGRFGVGVLAAFLLGNEVYVQTRKASSSIGFEFKASLNSDQINILKKNDLKAGTSIKIKIHEEILAELKKGLTGYQGRSAIRWTEWYTLSVPEVKYYFFGEELIPYKNKDPYYTHIPKDWQSINSDGFEKILWTYEKGFSDKELVCNGIVIPDAYDKERSELGLIFNKPKLIVFDNDGLLPISLNRNELTDKLPFIKDLKIDIYKDLIARLLSLKDHSSIKENKILIGSQNLDYPGNLNNYYTYNSYGPNNYLFSSAVKDNHRPNNYVNRNFLDQILISKKGYVLNYNYFLNSLSGARLLLLQSESIDDESIALDIEDRFLLISQTKLNSIDDYKSAIEGNFYNPDKGVFEKYATRIFLKNDRYHYLFQSKVKRVSDWLKLKCKVESEYKTWIKLNLDSSPDSVITDKFLLAYKDKINFIREAPLYCFGEGDHELNELFEKYIGKNVIIPYSLKERKEKYALAFEELEGYLKKYL